MVKLKGVKCHAYFGGVDGNGTCDTVCQWWTGYACPMWIGRDLWNTEKDIFRDKEEVTIKEFEKVMNVKIKEV